MTAPAPTSGLYLHANAPPHVDAPPPFLATGWSAPDLVGVTVVGELDLATAPVLAAEVSSVCRAGASGDVREFLLDLSGVTFLDSAGLRAADRAQRGATNWGWRVRVVQPTASEPRQMIALAIRKELSTP